MSFIKSTRALFILMVVVFSFVLLDSNGYSWSLSSGIALVAGLVAGLLVLMESCIRAVHPKVLVVGLLGLTAGLLSARLLTQAIPIEILSAPMVRQATHLSVHLIFGYLGLVLALRYVDSIDLNSPGFIRRSDTHLSGGKIVDTSALIDGRIADIAPTHFLDGVLVIPQFVLQEVQHIADSPDPFRRQRGRRGLDTVRRMQAELDNIEIVDRDYPGAPDADTKLVELAKDIEGRIVTTDYNLNKIAAINYISVLNINDLANALKPVVLPGEHLEVALLKEGKDPHQGVGYLDDGTMVVVDRGQELIGKTVSVVVTSMLQTPAGRMVFARPDDEG